MLKSKIKNQKPKCWYLIFDIWSFSRGQSMIEMLVAVSIIGASLVGILALVNRSLGLNRVAAEQYLATYLAAEGIELVKNMFDHSYLAEARANPGSNNFYGWAGTDEIAPGGSYGIYEVQYDDQALTDIPGACSLVPPPSQVSLIALFSGCDELRFLNFSNGLYRYDPGGNTSKFKRVIVIDFPEEFSGAGIAAGENLDWRVTSAVYWQSRGGEFLVHLQDHFLPWRIP